MKIIHIQSHYQNNLYKQQVKVKHKELYNELNNKNIYNIQQPSYMDININFRGRTPENFYQQKFNIENMPETMKEYLNTNYDTRKKLPPEQVMSEAFKYLEIANNFDDVKSIYPNEPLFNELHEHSKNIYNGIIAEINSAKNIENIPLLKNGDDNLGIYLLRKIFLEGKTIKEINQDFYEKDINTEYKGIITKPITYSTTAAYGIKYPKTDFWNSFINTREEYKKFFVDIPKQDKAELQRELTHRNHIHQSDRDATKPHKQYVRKYKLKTYQKEHLKNDIKDNIKKGKIDAKVVENVIGKHFKANDPEASFIVKYLSPIMTVAAERIHLSEEERYFAESLKNNSGKIENFLAKFWKANPQMTDQYSNAIIDTIELFEETYSDGGMLPIDNEYKVIMPNSKNQKAIDYVPERFVELLDYVQQIGPNRKAKYALHDELQKQWDEHMLWRYGGIVQDNVDKQAEKQPIVDVQEALTDIAKKNNAQVYKLKAANGEMVDVTLNIDEEIESAIKNLCDGYPNNFIKLFVSKIKKYPSATEFVKLSFATMSVSNHFNDERLASLEELQKIIDDIIQTIHNENTAATSAMIDVYALLSKNPIKLYRFGYNSDHTEDVQELKKMINAYKLIPSVQDNLNKFYDKYKKDLTYKEINELSKIIVKNILTISIDDFYDKNSILYKSTNLDKIINIRDLMFKDNSFFKIIKQECQKELSKINFAKTIFNKTNSEIINKAKIDMITQILIDNIINKNEIRKYIK